MLEFSNQIVNGDCLKEIKNIPDKSFDLVFADPPYNMQIGEKLTRPDSSKVIGVNDKSNSLFVRLSPSSSGIITSIIKRSN